MGKNPFNISPDRVSAAAVIFPDRAILVAPGFFEPNVLGSGSFNALEINTEKGIEPIMYKKMKMTISVITQIIYHRYNLLLLS